MKAKERCCAFRLPAGLVPARSRRLLCSEATRDHLNAAVAGDSARISQLVRSARLAHLLHFAVLKWAALCVPQTEEIRALEQHVQETKALYLSQRADCERGRAEIKALKASLDASQVCVYDRPRVKPGLSGDVCLGAGRSRRPYTRSGSSQQRHAGYCWTRGGSTRAAPRQGAGSGEGIHRIHAVQPGIVRRWRPGQACDDMRACAQPDHDHVQTAAGGSGQAARSQRRQTCRAQPGSGRPKLSDRCVGAESA